jgi:hypothetical protein
MNKKELLFELTRTAVIGENGDGDVIIVSKQYEKLAKDFLEYEKRLNVPYFIREVKNSMGSILFTPEDEFAQEGIIFSCDVGLTTSFGFYELVILARDIFD